VVPVGHPAHDAGVSGAAHSSLPPELEPDPDPELEDDPEPDPEPAPEPEPDPEPDDDPELLPELLPLDDPVDASLPPDPDSLLPSAEASVLSPPSRSLAVAPPQ
jgi:hypothetical protein